MWTAHLKIHTSEDAVRVFLQAIAFLLGLCGLGLIFGSLALAYAQIRSGEDAVWFIFNFILLGFGAYLIGVAYLMIAKFSIRAIRYLCLTLAIVVWQLAEIPIDQALRSHDADYRYHSVGLLPFIPIVVALIFYKIAKRMLILWSGAYKTAPANERWRAGVPPEKNSLSIYGPANHQETKE